jgi:hypothetical protein
MAKGDRSAIVTDLPIEDLQQPKSGGGGASEFLARYKQKKETTRVPRNTTSTDDEDERRILMSSNVSNKAKLNAPAKQNMFSALRGLTRTTNEPETYYELQEEEESKGSTSKTKGGNKYTKL